MRALLLSLALLAAPLAAQAPRELSEAQKARLKQSVTQDKASGQKAADEAMARQQQLARDQQAEAERARQQQQAAYEAAYDDSGPEPVQQSGGGAAAILNAFTGAFSSEYQKNMDVVNRGNAAVDYNRQQMIAEQQRQQRQRELAEQQERARQQAARQQAAQQQRMADQQRAANAASTSPAATAQRNADLQQQAAAERQRLAAERQIQQSAERQKQATAQREQEAAAERARVMAPFVGSSRQQQAANAPGNPGTTAGTASAMAAPKAVATPADHGPARAWCQASEARTYQCMGPLQRSMSWEKTLEYALSVVGCTGGQGYNPTPGHGGSAFNCGRQLQVGEYRMPTYDPFRGGGSPTRVTAGF